METTKAKASIPLIIGIVIVVLILVVLMIFSIPGNKTEESEENSGANNVIAQTDEGMAEITRTAMTNRDVELCETISREDAKQYCVTSVIITKAGDTKDPSICNQIPDSNSRMACKDNIIIAKARDSKDPDFCEGLLDRNRAAECRKIAQ